MRFGSPQLEEVLRGSFNHRYLADLHYDGRRVLADVPIINPRFSENGDASVQQSGSCTVVWQDYYGRSMSPTEIGDIFAPFGAELHVYDIVWLGGFMERIPLGVFRIVDVPSARDETQLFGGRTISTGSVIDLKLKELLAVVQEDRFDVPTAPTDLSSVWREMGRLTGLQLTRTLPDAQITRAVAYKEDRLEALYDLANILDGIPHMTPDGTLSLRPKDWPDPVDTLVRGPSGSIISVGRFLSSGSVYNRVTVRGKTDDGVEVLATAEIPSGPLRTLNPDGSRSPYGRRTFFVSSDLIENQAQAREYAARQLPRVSTLQAVVVPVVEKHNPLRERGDVVTIQRADTALTGRIITIERGGGQTMPMTAEVLP